MAFNLKGFAGGLADSGTTYFEGKAEDRKDAVAAKRTLIYNATDSIYTKAQGVKDENQKQAKVDKQYISYIKTLDPQISKDNQAKLLSLDVDKRKQAESEFMYRKNDNPTVTFGDFMTYVKEPEDLDNTLALDETYKNELITPSKGVESYYDKTGLIPDSRVQTIYNEVADVMTNIHGYSPAQAKKISEQSVYAVQHPPIRIAWSEATKLKEQDIKDRATIVAGHISGLKQSITNITNSQVDLSVKAITAGRNLFASNYMSQSYDSDRKPIVDDKGEPVLTRMPAGMAAGSPTFEADWLKSQAYQQLALDSMESHINGIMVDPDNFKESSTTYMNTAFPGMYGGILDVSTVEGVDKATAIDPNMVYGIKADSTSDAGEEGRVFMGWQILQIPEIRDAFNRKKAGDGDDNTDKVDKTETTVADPAATLKTTVEETAAMLEDAKESGETEEMVVQLEAQLVRDKAAVVKEELHIKNVARDSAFYKDWEENLPETAGSSLSEASAALDEAIETGDVEALRGIIDKLATIKDNYDVSMGLSTKMGKIRGNAKRAIRDIERDAEFETGVASLTALRKRAASARSTKTTDADIKALIKDINTYSKTATNDEQLMELDGLKTGLYSLL